eukprot:gene36293-47233_t
MKRSQLIVLYYLQFKKSQSQKLLRPDLQGPGWDDRGYVTYVTSPYHPSGLTHGQLIEMMAARKPERLGGEAILLLQLRRRAKRWPLTQDYGCTEARDPRAGSTAAATGYSLAERHGREAKLHRCCWVLADCTHGNQSDLAEIRYCCSCNEEPIGTEPDHFLCIYLAQESNLEPAHVTFGMVVRPRRAALHSALRRNQTFPP